MAVLAAIVARGQQPATARVAAVPGQTAIQAIDAAAAALGGADRIRALRNLTLIGYAQYAYQNGGGNISPLPGAPQKFIAANDYRAFEKPVLYTWGSLTHPRWRSMEQRLSNLFPNFSSEMFEGLHHLNTCHTAEPARVAARLSAFWQDGV